MAKTKDPIVQEGTPVLRQIAKAVSKKDIGSSKLNALVEHMREVLSREEYGVALAAPQVGESLRLFVVAGRVFDKESEESLEPEDMVFINPEIIRLSKKTALMEEGCLSVRHKYGTVVRHEKATVKAVDMSGKPFTYHGTGLLAHIFQHECDHLDGILYIDKAASLEEDEDLKSARQKLRERAIQ